jgi:hypothetical protein
MGEIDMTAAWGDLPKWQRVLIIVVGGNWYLHQLAHPWLFELYGHLAMVARLVPH